MNRRGLAFALFLCALLVPLVACMHQQPQAFEIHLMWADGGAARPPIHLMAAGNYGPRGPASGDLGGTYPNPTVAKLQTQPVSTTAPTSTAQALMWSGSAWAPAVPATGTSGITQLTGPVTAGPGSGSQAAAINFGGGSLSGTLGLANGGTGLNTASGLAAGNVLQANTSTSIAYGAVNLAGGSNYVTGTLPTGNQAAQSMGGDTTGTTASATVTQAQNGKESFGTTGTITCSQPMSACGLAQTSTSSATNGADMTDTPQQSTHTTDQGGGNRVFTFQAPTGTGQEGYMVGKRGSSIHWELGPYPGFPTSDTALWLAAPGSLTLDANHITLYSNGTDGRLGGSASSGLTVGGSNYLFCQGAPYYGCELPAGEILHVGNAGSDVMAVGATGGGMTLTPNVINATSGTVNPNATQASSVHQQISATLSNNLTIDYPNVAGFYIFNTTAISYASHTITVECGTPGTTVTFSVAANTPAFPICWCDGANNFYCR